VTNLKKNNSALSCVWSDWNVSPVATQLSRNIGKTLRVYFELKTDSGYPKEVGDN